MKSAKFVSLSQSFVHSWQEFSPDLAELFRDGDISKFSKGEVIWKTRHKCVTKCEFMVNGVLKTLVFKRYYEKRFFRYLFRPSLAAREAKGYGIVNAADIPCATLLGYGEIRHGVRLNECFLLTEYLAGTRDGEVFCPGGALTERIDLRDEFCRQTLSMLKNLHRKNYIHGGTHPRNFLWRQSEAGDLSVIWIDLATVKRGCPGKQQLDVENFLAPLLLKPEEAEKYRRFYLTLFN
ncbi:MAG: lipopolysaccharide kinase InaA family protein [Lentisphaeria bacterium]|nr:lipopolysaccharide kinase InaA family protein [Lentisphaeria bacterium]